jgi:hypothetical protein
MFQVAWHYPSRIFLSMPIWRKSPLLAEHGFLRKNFAAQINETLKGVWASSARPNRTNSHFI